MKKTLITAAIVAGAATAANAADLPRKAPVYKAPVMQVYDWTGFYIGANFGGSVGRDLTRASANGPGGTPIFNERSHLSPAGAIGGGQIGYNWQFRNFYNLVLGVEADIQASGQRDNFLCGLNCVPGTLFTGSQKLDWFGTARVRAGLATGPVLTYITGGYAYGHYETTASGLAAGTAFTQTTSGTKGGYTIGSGVEAQLSGNWTGKIEYLYVRLQGTSAGAVLPGGITTFGSTRVEDHIFRAGVNYNFGKNANYVAPLANWSGFYVGGNVGSVIGRNRSSDTFAGAAPRFTLVPEGYIGGGQVGYNWQAGAWVLGAEADFQGSTAKDKKACVFFCIPGAGIAPEQKLSYLGTVRGRVGYSVGSTLFYGTAGFAYGETKTRLTEVAGAATATIDLKRSKGGYAVGAGIESPFNPLNLFGPNWTSKTEYLYVDLGRSTFNFAPAGFAAQTFSTKNEEHIFRTGINYHFNTVAPVVAKY
ncbi:MAG: hypothetical protein A4S14_07285 [Proteobacteria bacterium SG_bin9]|nr:MAG: hypothetical protein A4S14_07285 [Proteobacteria bacterium SG_bin9]